MIHSHLTQFRVFNGEQRNQVVPRNTFKIDPKIYIESEFACSSSSNSSVCWVNGAAAFLYVSLEHWPTVHYFRIFNWEFEFRATFPIYTINQLKKFFQIRFFCNWIKFQIWAALAGKKITQITDSCTVYRGMWRMIENLINRNSFFVA